MLHAIRYIRVAYSVKEPERFSTALFCCSSEKTVAEIPEAVPAEAKIAFKCAVFCKKTVHRNARIRGRNIGVFVRGRAHGRAGKILEHGIGDNEVAIYPDKRGIELQFPVHVVGVMVVIQEHHDRSGIFAISA